MKNRTNFTIGITVCGLSILSVNVVDFGPIKLSFAIHAWFLIINSFAAFFLCVVEYFAVDTKFTISGGIVALILGRSVVVVVSSVIVLSSGRISPVAVLLLAELLLLWMLWPECSHIGIHVGCLRVLTVLDSMNCERRRLTFVLFNSVLREEGLVGLIHREPGLILVRKQFANIFRSSSLENLCEQKLVVSFYGIIRILHERILRVVTIHKLSGPVWFDSVRGKVFVGDVAQFFQTGKESPGILTLPMRQVCEAVNDEFVVSGRGEFSFE